MSPVTTYRDYHAWCDNGWFAEDGSFNENRCSWNGDGGDGNGNYTTRAAENRALREHQKVCEFKPGEQGKVQ